MGCMKELHNELHLHYALLLGVKSPWEVTGVELDMEARRVEIGLEWGRGHEVTCPECGKRCAMADHAPERTWRHLDTMQFETRIRARTPRSRCPEHGVKTVVVPWADPGSRFTLLFERLASRMSLWRISSIVTRCEVPARVRFVAKVLRKAWKSAYSPFALVNSMFAATKSMRNLFIRGNPSKTRASG